MREVRQLVDDLLINSTDDDESADESIPDSKIVEAIPKKQTMLTPGAISPSRLRKTNQGPFSSLTFNPAVRNVCPRSFHLKFYFQCKMSDSKSHFMNKNSKTMTYGGSSCSMANSSPFGGHL